MCCVCEAGFSSDCIIAYSCVLLRQQTVQFSDHDKVVLYHKTNQEYITGYAPGERYNWKDITGYAPGESPNWLCIR
jgi:hypothetical protein